MNNPNFNPIRLKAGFMRELKNYEFLVVYRDLVGAVSNSDVEDPYVIDRLNAVSNDLSHIERLSKIPAAHANSVHIDTKFGDMRGYMKAIRSYVDGLKGVSDPELSKSVLTLHQWMRKNRKNMISQVKGRMIEAVVALNRGVAESSEVLNALEEHNLAYLFERVVELLGEIETLRSARNYDRGRNKEDRSDIYSRSIFDMQMLFYALMGKANSNDSDSSNYFELCQDLNNILISSRAILLSRETRNENEKGAIDGDETSNEDGDNIRDDENDESNHNTETDPE